MATEVPLTVFGKVVVVEGVKHGYADKVGLLLLGCGVGWGSSLSGSTSLK